MGSPAVLARYWVMQLPGILLVMLLAVLLARDFGWPQWTIWAAVGAWVAKDALLYLIVWPAYDPDRLSPFPYRMEGATGVALHRIEKAGTVRVWGELWNAHLSPQSREIDKGEKVRVRACHGLTLVVEPVES